MIVSLAEVKAYLNISGTDDDAFLASQIAVVSDAIEGYCRRKFEAANYIQTFYAEDYANSAQLSLAVWPVNSITSIVQDGTALLTSDYRAQNASGYLTRPYSQGWFTGCVDTIVSYNAGYLLADIPPIVKSVAYGVIGSRYAKKSAGVDLNFGNDVQRVSIPGTISIDFDYTLTNNDRTTPFGAIIGDYLNLLDYYRSDRAILGNGRLLYVST